MDYKSISKIDHHLSPLYLRLKAMYDRPHKSSPCRNMEWWLGRGRPLDPYTWIDYLREFSKPRDLKLAPEECYLHFKVQEFEEY